MARAHFPLILGIAAALWVQPAGGSVVEDRLFRDLVTLPSPGARDLRVLGSRLLEVRIVQGRNEPGAKIGPAETDFPPIGPGELRVFVDGVPVETKEIGVKRLPVYADYHQFDLRLMFIFFCAWKSRCLRTQTSR